MEIHYYCIGCFRDLDEHDEEDFDDIEWVYVEECEYCQDELWEDEVCL